MLDTAKIYFNSRQFDFSSTSRFEGCFSRERRITDYGPSGAKEVSHIRRVLVTKERKAAWGGYFPKIFVQRFPFRQHPWSYQLGVELSVPKFVHGTSLYEFDEIDMDAFARKLRKIMWYVGVVLNEWQVPLGTVTMLDYCKNFILPPGISSHHFFAVIKDYQIKKTSEFNYVRYGNGAKGEQVNYFQANKNMRIYEKLTEVAYRAKTAQELAVVENPPFIAVPRMELAIHDTRTFNQIMSRARVAEGLVAKPHYTVADLFRRKLARRVLTTEFKEVVEPSATSLIAGTRIEDDVAFSMIQGVSSSYELSCIIDKIRRDAQSVGLKNAFARFKQEYTLHKSEASYYRLKSDVEDVLRHVNLPKSTSSFDVLRLLKTQLKQFDLLRPPAVQPTLPMHAITPTTTNSAPPVPPTP